MGDIKQTQRDIADLALVPIEGMTRLLATIGSNIDALSALAAWCFVEFGQVYRESIARVLEDASSEWAPKPASPPALRLLARDGQPPDDSTPSTSA